MGEVDPQTDLDELASFLTMALIGVAAPLIAIFVVQRSKLRTTD